MGISSKNFEEERELTVYLMVDISASGEFGSGSQLKRELGTEIAAVLGFSAIKNNDNLYGEAKFDLMLDLTEGFILQDQEFNPIKFMLACYDEDLVDEDTKSRLLRGLKN